MANYIDNIKDQEDNIIYPITKANAVFLDDNTTIENKLTNGMVNDSDMLDGKHASDFMLHFEDYTGNIISDDTLKNAIASLVSNMGDYNYAQISFGCGAAIPMLGNIGGRWGGCIVRNSNKYYSVLLHGYNGKVYNYQYRDGTIECYCVSDGGNAKSMSTDGSVKIYAENADEVNFGGTGTGTTIAFGYRGKDSRPAPTTYHFGLGGGASIKCNNIQCTTINGIETSDFASSELLNGLKIYRTYSDAKYSSPCNTKQYAYAMYDFSFGIINNDQLTDAPGNGIVVIHKVCNGRIRATFYSKDTANGDKRMICGSDGNLTGEWIS